jgi:uncharacterized membrane protein
LALAVPVALADHRSVVDVAMGVAVFVLLILGLILDANLFTAWDARRAAKAALHAALERGDIREEEYAAHLRALEEAA